MIQKHQSRLLIIATLNGVAIIALVVAAAIGASAEVLTAITGALAILVPALVDAAQVERRRRDPKVPALLDDVREPEHKVANHPDRSRERSVP